MKDVKSEEDIALIANLAKTIWNECYRDLLSQKQRDYMLNLFLNNSAINKNIADGYIYKLLIHNDKEVGYMAYKDNNNHIYLSKLYLLNEYRGYKIASYCIEYLKQFNKDIYLNVNKYNKLGYNFYLQKGFKNIRCEINDIGNGYVMDDYVMCLYVK